VVNEKGQTEIIYSPREDTIVLHEGNVIQTLWGGKGMKLTRITAILIAIIVLVPVISGLWIGGYLSPKKAENKTILPKSMAHVKVLDIWGQRENSSESDIMNIRFNVSVWEDHKGYYSPLDITKINIHWAWPKNTVRLYLNRSAPDIATPTNFSATLICASKMSPNGWNPANGQFLVYSDCIVSLGLSLGIEGLNDSLSPNETVNVVFEPESGLIIEEQITTPRDYGNNTFIDLAR
jgi:hypothetical protein